MIAPPPSVGAEPGQNDSAGQAALGILDADGLAALPGQHEGAAYGRGGVAESSAMRLVLPRAG